MPVAWKLTLDQKNEIEKLYINGVGAKELAKRYNVHYESIRYILGLVKRKKNEVQKVVDEQPLNLEEFADWYKKIKALRVYRGFGQIEMAKSCKTDQKGYWGWESGKHYPGYPKRKLIAKALKVEMFEIFGESAGIDDVPKRCLVINLDDME